MYEWMVVEVSCCCWCCCYRLWMVYANDKLYSCAYGVNKLSLASSSQKMSAFSCMIFFSFTAFINVINFFLTLKKGAKFSFWKIKSIWNRARHKMRSCSKSNKLLSDRILISRWKWKQKRLKWNGFFSKFMNCLFLVEFTMLMVF